MDDESQSILQSSSFSYVPIEVTVSVGRVRPKVRDLIKIAPNSILQLDKKISDPVDLFVGDRLIARGELQELDGDVEGQLSVRLIEVVDLGEAL